MRDAQTASQGALAWAHHIKPATRIAVGYLLTVVMLALAIGALGLFFWIAHSLTKAVGDLAHWAYMLAFKKRPPRALSMAGLGATWLALVVAAPMQGCDYYQVRLYKEAIPAKLQLADLIYHDEQSDLREGCGEAVFRLSDESLASIKRQGLAYFNDATLGRDGARYHQYAAWQTLAHQQTPQDRLLRGAHCIEDLPAMWDDIQRAVAQGEGFFTTGQEQDLIVIPKLGVIVFSHNG